MRRGTAFAPDTHVPPSTTRRDIERELDRFGAERINYMDDPPRHRKIFVFEMYDDRVAQPGWYPFSFGIPFTGTREDWPVWRGALRYIQGNLVGIDYKIVSPVVAFHAFIVTETGETMLERTKNLLPAPVRKKRD
jgi:hypothetical protein